MTERLAVSDLDFEPRHLLGVVVGSVVLGGFVAWMTADLVDRGLSFLVVATLAGYFLHRTVSRREQVVFVGYAIAGLLVLTPVFVILPDALSGSTYGPGATSMVFTTANLAFFLLFAILAGIVAYATYRYDGGAGIVRRIRSGRHASQ